jgi:signal peptidase I
MDIKEALKKTWNFLWKDDSIWSWIISLILAFIIVKFIFFPLLSLAFQTYLPLVVVESSSMHHTGNFFGKVFSTQGNFDLWWQSSGQWYLDRNITREQAEKWPLRTGFEKGDIMIVSGWDKNPEVGDVIIFNANTVYPIIHRIMNIKTVDGQVIYETKGDNNADQLTIEKNIPKNAIVGKAVFRIPLLGWAKLAFVNLFSIFK